MNIKVLTLIILCAVIIGVDAAAQNRVYTVNRLISGGTVNIPDNSIVRFTRGGKIVNATVTGRNLTVEPSGTNPAFAGCDFRNATIVNSTLHAANLGFVSDMTAVDFTFDYKGLRLNTRRHTGTDNTAAWKQLEQLLSGSDGVTVDFDGGKYFNTSATRFIIVSDAVNLRFTGGSVIMGLRLANCSHVKIHHMNWLGYHEAHDFPPIYDKEPVTFNGVKYTTANSFKMKGDGLANLGVADDGILAYVDTDGKTSSDIDIRHCHFEMRQGGIMVGTRSDKRITTDVTADSCTMSHIAYQPLGFHASRCTATHITSDYCFQPIDISTCTNHVTVSDSRFTRCATGPKQETGEQFRSMLHDNAITRCHFEINDDYFMLDGSQFTLSIAEGAPDDVFRMTDCTFNVKKNRGFGGVRCRTSRAVFTNVTFNYDINLHPKNKSKWSMTEVFSVFGKSASKPQFELDNVTVNLSRGTRVNNLCFPHVAGVDMRFSATRLKVNGAGSIKAYFNNVKDLRINNSELNAQATSLFTGDKNTVTSLKDNTIRCRKVADTKRSPAIDRRSNTLITN